jgi:hypothetical protein
MAKPIEATPDLDPDEWEKLLEDLEKNDLDEESKKKLFQRAKEIRNWMMNSKRRSASKKDEEDQT